MRIGYSAREGGFRGGQVIDLTRDEVYNLCLDELQGVDDGYSNDKPLIIWGAPGVGSKTSIMKQLIKAYNETQTDNKNKKSLITIDCGSLTLDDFFVPSIIQNDDGTGQSTDLIKTWLPVWKPVRGDKEKTALLAKNANEYEQDDGIVTGNGGVIFFDELFRANDDVFKVVVNLAVNRTFTGGSFLIALTGGYVLGDKWTIILGSSRPFDDSEVKKNYISHLSAAFLDRFTHVCLVPDAKDLDE